MVYQVQKNEMGGACSTYGGRGDVLMGKLEGRDHLEDPDVDGRIILQWFFGKWDGGMDWIDLAQDMDRWRAGSIKCWEFLEYLRTG